MSASIRSVKNRKTATFSYHAQDAKAVYVAGSFNDWNPEATPMTNNDSGEWIVNLELASGTYEYRYVVDGQWCNEPECSNHERCPNCGPNPFGSKNQILHVE